MTRRDTRAHSGARRLPHWAALAALLYLLASPGAYAACRQALSLGLDVSGSVDREEYALQITGVAQALRDPEVQKAFLAMPDAIVRLHIYEWAGSGSKRVLLDWRDIASPDDLDAAARALSEAPSLRPREPGTGLGEALRFGGRALSVQSDCWRRTLDISGDGPSNTGPRPRDVADIPELSDITVNALVIGSNDAWRDEQAFETLDALVQYFRAEVIRGPDAFVEVTASYADYEPAIARKLLRELQTLAIGLLAPMSLHPDADAG